MLITRKIIVKDGKHSSILYSINEILNRKIDIPELFSGMVSIFYMINEFLSRKIDILELLFAFGMRLFTVVHPKMSDLEGNNKI